MPSSGCPFCKIPLVMIVFELLILFPGLETRTLDQTDSNFLVPCLLAMCHPFAISVCTTETVKSVWLVAQALQETRNTFGRERDLLSVMY
ncbi:hypothetical protein BKA67DRAFT_572841 [Truncatella angustata]|uniref:Secreted protein n=1 Tax=Truncatella angustata TaxID=152316 RepID=A0A9P8ZVJ5_9PEZI|nr:uncharacterized protein BKA67DRAFT_572841 [Truncatella angustata]KAH6652080.1 hypothetical protein BKA67DRAFT_572841 [Truncatella angustata]